MEINVSEKVEPISLDIKQFIRDFFVASSNIRVMIARRRKEAERSNTGKRFIMVCAVHYVCLLVHNTSYGFCYNIEHISLTLLACDGS
jgi:hypothetical protein